MTNKTENPREYSSWLNMRTRCNNPNYYQWHLYGGRGITCCARWARFKNFLEDLGPVPGDGFTLERRDSDGNYEPDNCYWATRTAQALSRRGTKWGTAEGLTLCAQQWADRLGISRNAFYTKARKVGVEEAIRFYREKGY